MSQTLRTLGAGALGAFIVAIAALSVRTRRSAERRRPTPAAHTITVSATGKVTVAPDVARINLGVTATKPTVKATRQAGAKAMTDIIAALKALGIADADIETTNISLYPQYGSGPTPKVVGYQISEQVEVTVRDLDKAGDAVDAATPRARPTSTASRSSWPIRSRPERRPGGGRRGGTGQRPGDGERRPCVARRGRLDHRRDPVLTDLLRLWRAQGSRRRSRTRDPGPAGHPGPERHRHGRLRDQLTGRGAGRCRRRVPSGGAATSPVTTPADRPGRARSVSGSPPRPGRPSSMARPIRRPRSRSAPSRRWPWPASPARWRWPSSSAWPWPGILPRPAVAA